MGVVIFFAVVTVGLGLWGAVNPQNMWLVLKSWQYKNPDAHQPSEAQHTVTRVSSIVAIVAVAVLVPVTASAMNENEENNERERYDDCLAEHRDSDGLLEAEDWCENLEPDG